MLSVQTTAGASLLTGRRGRKPVIYQTPTNLNVCASYILTFYSAAGQQLNTAGAIVENGDPRMGFIAGVALTRTPEPSGIALIGVGLIGLVVVRRKLLKSA
jgi:hypothetical protein